MTDPDDVLLAARFEAFRRSVPDTFTTPPTTSIYAAARSRSGRRRVRTAVTAGLAVLAAVATGLTVRLSTAAHQPPLPDTPVPPTTSAPPSTSPSATPRSTPPAVTNIAVPRDIGNKVRFLDNATADRVRRMTVTLPAWPNPGMATTCPAGRHTFADGRAATGVDSWAYVVLFKGGRGVFANVDGAPGDEIVLPIGCGAVENSFRLLVLSSQLQVFGYVADFAAMPDFGRYYPLDGDLVVEVSEHGMGQGALQRRRYEWQGSRFVQVGGPTSFPKITDIRAVDLRNASMEITLSRQPGGPDNFGASLSFVDGVGGLWAYRSEEFTHPGADFLVGAVSPGFLTEPGDTASDVLVTLTCRWDDDGVDQFLYKASWAGGTSLIVRTGVDGVTGVVSHRIVDGLAEVVVNTAAGPETRRYRSNGLVFTRVG